jgi:YHS domain-containing protein
MKKFLIVVVLALITGFASLAQKSSTFIHSGKAIRGYDPVAYFTDGQPVMGADSLNLEWHNATWYFASRKNLELFRKNPEKYAPQYGGYCAYGLSNGYKAQTDPQAWTIENGKLYLNYNLNVRGEWNKNRKERIENADKNWPDVKDKGKE